MTGYTPSYGIHAAGSRRKPPNDPTRNPLMGSWTGSARKAPASRSDESRMEELTTWVRHDLDRWELRQTRFQRDQDLYRLTRPAEIRAKNPADLVILNDPKVLVKKLARLIARHPNVIEVPAAPDVEDPTISQRIENYLYAWDQAINQQWMMRLRNPYRYDQAFYTILRGWLCERTMLNPEGSFDRSGRNDPAALWSHDVVDPALVFPYEAGNGIKRVTHAYQSTIGELRSDEFYENSIRNSEALGDADDRTIVQCRGVYWYGDKSWWHAVLLSTGPTSNTSAGTEWVKKPVELGYNPWTIALANGAAYRQTPWDDQLYIDEIGTGVLDESVDTFKYLNRMATKLSELLSLEANPPLTIYSGTGEQKKVSFEPGARNFLAEKDKLEAHRIGPAMGDYQLLWDILSQRAARAGLPPAFFAEYGGESGFSASVLMAAGKDVLFPFVEAINLADALKYRKILEIYRDFGPSQPLPSSLPSDQKTGAVLSAHVTAADIEDQGTLVKITREDMTPQELATRINLGLAMLDKNAISLETFRRDWAKVQNPAGENQQVLAERVYMDPNVIQELSKMALSSTGQDFIRQLWETVQNPMPGAQPGGGGPPPTPQMPGLPAEVVPPNLQPQAGPPGMAAMQDPTMQPPSPLLQLLQGGAMGGAGMGGTPPIPGLLPVPPLPGLY